VDCSSGAGVCSNPQCFTRPERRGTISVHNCHPVLKGVVPCKRPHRRGKVMETVRGCILLDRPAQRVCLFRRTAHWLAGTSNPRRTCFSMCPVMLQLPGIPPNQRTSSGKPLLVSLWRSAWRRVFPNGGDPRSLQWIALNFMTTLVPRESSGSMADNCLGAQRFP